jgi:arginyl-tRNA synthetase
VRGLDEVIDVVAADHHGYVPRVKAAMQAFSGRADALSAPLIQFVSLFRGTERVAMSTRSGEFITLRQLRQEVGNDAARFFYVMRKGDQAMDFDLELAISKSNENPVYYIQYAHARVASVLRQLIDKGISWSVGEGLEHLSLLTEEAERQLLKTINHYPNLLETAAINYEPHQLVHYLRQLANEFHSYYNSQQFIVEDAALRQARLNLICAVQQVIANGLGLLGVSAPEEM